MVNKILCNPITILLSPPRQDSLHHKRSLLLRQTEDALELKENFDRRQHLVHTILSSYFTELQLQDYHRFVSTKPSLLIRLRHLDDLIRQGEEQLTRLAESLPQELAEALGWSRACPFSSSSPAPHSSAFPPLLPPSVIPGPTHSVRSTTVTSLWCHGQAAIGSGSDGLEEETIGSLKTQSELEWCSKSKELYMRKIGPETGSVHTRTTMQTSHMKKKSL